MVLTKFCEILISPALERAGGSKMYVQEVSNGFEKIRIFLKNFKTPWAFSTSFLKIEGQKSAKRGEIGTKKMVENHENHDFSKFRA